MPPYSCLTMTMAKNAPTTTIQNGIEAGRQKASKIPVTTADRSPMVSGLCTSLRYKNSNATQEQTLTSVTKSARSPNAYTLHASAGTSARMTSSIMNVVVTGLCTCGEALIFKNFLFCGSFVTDFASLTSFRQQMPPFFCEVPGSGLSCCGYAARSARVPDRYRYNSRIPHKRGY